jgi:hypothetical protein
LVTGIPTHLVLKMAGGKRISQYLPDKYKDRNLAAN